MSDESNAVVLEPPEPANAAVIWLHGLGADGNDFVPVVPELDASLRHRTRFVFPHARQQPVTINGGMVMRAWYDISDMDFPRQADEIGITNSQARLGELIEENVRTGIPPERIVLAGFSQGGVIALRSALLHEHKLAGVMALSTYLPMQQRTREERGAANLDTPIFMAHGRLDPLIPIEAAEQTRAFLDENGYRVEWHSYQMDHSVCGEEIRDIDTWLSGVLP